MNEPNTNPETSVPTPSATTTPPPAQDKPQGSGVMPLLLAVAMGWGGSFLFNRVNQSAEPPDIQSADTAKTTAQKSEGVGDTASKTTESGKSATAAAMTTAASATTQSPASSAATTAEPPSPAATAAIKPSESMDALFAGLRARTAAQTETDEREVTRQLFKKNLETLRILGQ